MKHPFLAGIGLHGNLSVGHGSQARGTWQLSPWDMAADLWDMAPRWCLDDTAHDPNGPDDTDRGYGRFGPVRYTPIYTPRYDNLGVIIYHCVVLVTII